MELKLIGSAPTSQKTSSSNCTFMELKYTCEARGIDSGEVLIVPLWNWNEYNDIIKNFERAF